MKRIFLGLLAAALVTVGGSSNAKATEGTLEPPGAIHAYVVPVATPISAVDTIFDFVLVNCPVGMPIIVVEWNARQPDRPDSAATIAESSHGDSNGKSSQQLTDLTGSSSFLPGERWVGSGLISCGPTVVPVAGSGITKSVNGGLGSTEESE